MTDGGQPKIFKLGGLQIVNGAQTTSSIERLFVRGQLPSDIFVSVKLTKVEEAGYDLFVEQITVCANSENPIRG